MAGVADCACSAAVIHEELRPISSFPPGRISPRISRGGKRRMYTCEARNPRFAVTLRKINQASYVRKRNKFHSIGIARRRARPRARACLFACLLDRLAFINKTHLHSGRLFAPTAPGRVGGRIIFPIPPFTNTRPGVCFRENTKLDACALRSTARSIQETILPRS